MCQSEIACLTENVVNERGEISISILTGVNVNVLFIARGRYGIQEVNGSMITILLICSISYV